MKENQIVRYKQNPLRLLADFSAETLQTRRECNDISECQKKKKSNQEYFCQKGYHSELKKKLFSRQAKARKVHHY